MVCLLLLENSGLNIQNFAVADEPFKRARQGESNHSMEVSIVDAALPIEYSWDCPYIQQMFHGKLLVETVSYRFQDTVNIQ